MERRPMLSLAGHRAHGTRGRLWASRAVAWALLCGAALPAPTARAQTEASHDAVAPPAVGVEAPVPLVAAPRRVSLGWMTAAFVAVQFATVALHRDDDAWTDDGHIAADGFTHAPVWDDDSTVYNYVLHPWVGSEYYLAARNREWGRWGSLGYSAALSTFYEYLPENLIQRPSANDLLVTPLAGALLGEARFALKQRIRRDPAAVPGARLWITLLDAVDLSIGGYPDGRARLHINWKYAF